MEVDRSHRAGTQPPAESHVKTDGMDCGDMQPYTESDNGSNNDAASDEFEQVSLIEDDEFLAVAMRIILDFLDIDVDKAPNPGVLAEMVIDIMKVDKKRSPRTRSPAASIHRFLEAQPAATKKRKVDSEHEHRRRPAREPTDDYRGTSWDPATMYPFPMAYSNPMAYYPYRDLRGSNVRPWFNDRFGTFFRPETTMPLTYNTAIPTTAADLAATSILASTSAASEASSSPISASSPPAPPAAPATTAEASSTTPEASSSAHPAAPSSAPPAASAPPPAAYPCAPPEMRYYNFAGCGRHVPVERSARERPARMPSNRERGFAWAFPVSPSPPASPPRREQPMLATYAAPLRQTPEDRCARGPVAPANSPREPMPAMLTRSPIPSRYAGGWSEPTTHSGDRHAASLFRSEDFILRDTPAYARYPGWPN